MQLRYATPPCTTPSLRYIYFQIAFLETSNIASSNVNGTLSRFAQYFGRLLFNRPGVPSNDLSTRKPKCSPGTLVFYLSHPPRGVLTNRCWVPLVGWIKVTQSTVRTTRVSHSRYTRLYLKFRGKQSGNKCVVAKALLTELRSERTDMEPQHLFFDSTEELSRQGYFQWIYSLRVAGTAEISVQPCLSFSSGKTYQTITRWNRFRSAWGAGKQQKLQHSGRVSRFYSQNISRIDLTGKTVAFPYKPW